MTETTTKPGSEDAGDSTQGHAAAPKPETKPDSSEPWDGVVTTEALRAWAHRVPDSDDGTERLCLAVYGRPAQPRDFLGGSNAHMLHDAADVIAKLRLERENDAPVKRATRRAEVAQASAFHRRAQKAEAWVMRTHAEIVDAGPANLGRGFANVAAAAWKRRADHARFMAAGWRRLARGALLTCDTYAPNRDELRAERDKARRDARKWQRRQQQTYERLHAEAHRATQAEAERDALRERVRVLEVVDRAARALMYGQHSPPGAWHDLRLALDAAKTDTR